MKNFLKTIIFAFLIIAIGSCEEDIDPKVSPNGFTLRAVDAPASLVLLPENDANTVTTLNWDRSDNGGMKSVSTYIIEVAKNGTNFENAVMANGGNNVTTDRTYILTVKELNQIVNQLPGYECGVQMAVDVRIKSTLGAGFYNALVQYSTNTITLNVTPYSSALPTLAFSATGVITEDTPKLASFGVLNTNYEGYMWLTPGSYKFYKPDACGNYASATVYGDNGGGTSTLTANGSAYVITTAGYYLVTANPAATGVNPLKYGVRATTWNLFGTAKTFPLANSAMTYDQTAKVWKASISLSTGYGFKFRSNGTGSNLFVLGKFVEGSVNNITYGGPVLSYVPNTTDTPSLPNNELSAPGNKTNPRTNKIFDVVLNLSSPRNYTYTITEQATP